MTGTAARLRRRAAADLQDLRVIRVPTNRPLVREGPAGTGVRHFRHEVGRRGRRDLRNARPRPAGAGGHPLHRQVGTSFDAIGRQGGSSTKCSMPITSPRRPRSWPRPGSGVGSPSHEYGRPRHRHQARPRRGRAGGLHVLGTELHDSAPHRPPACGPLRPPGRSRQSANLLALDDDLLTGGFGPDKAENTRISASVRRARSTSPPRLFRRPRERSSGAISATAGR